MQVKALYCNQNIIYIYIYIYLFIYVYIGRISFGYNNKKIESLHIFDNTTPEQYGTVCRNRSMSFSLNSFVCIVTRSVTNVWTSVNVCILLHVCMGHLILNYLPEGMVVYMKRHYNHHTVF